MGTNYYLKNKPCEKCGHSKNELHIGKSSAGWQFHFRGYRDQSIVSIEDWQREFENPMKEIRDEYGEIVTTEHFLQMVENKKELMNHWNIITGNPMKECEMKYMERNYLTTTYPDAKNGWKDDRNNPFTDCEFC